MQFVPHGDVTDSLLMQKSGNAGRFLRLLTVTTTTEQQPFDSQEGSLSDHPAFRTRYLFQTYWI